MLISFTTYCTVRPGWIYPTNIYAGCCSTSRPSSIRACEMRLIIDEKDVQEPSGPMSDPPAEPEALLGAAVLVDCSARDIVGPWHPVPR